MRILLERWVFSSAGRASPLQGEGRGFDPLNTHHFLKLDSPEASVIAGFFMPACYVETEENL